MVNDSVNSVMPMLLMFTAVLYFLVLRPQQKRQKEQESLLQGLEVGNEVATSGGILGSIVAIEDTMLVLEVDANTRIVVQKRAVASLLPKGTLKAMRKGKQYLT